jgi:hypothetical protein
MKMDLVLSAISGLLITFLVCNKWMLFIHVTKFSSNRWFHASLNMECQNKMILNISWNFLVKSITFYFWGSSFCQILLLDLDISNFVSFFF